MTENTELTGKVVLVTGASRGIGYAASIEAARRGAHVIAVARTVGALEELDDAIQEVGGSSTLVPLDLRDGDAIDRLGAAIFERWGHLDGLVASAGMLGTLSPVPHFKPDEFDKVMAVNVTANFRLFALSICCCGSLRLVARCSCLQARLARPAPSGDFMRRARRRSMHW